MPSKFYHHNTMLNAEIQRVVRDTAKRSNNQENFIREVKQIFYSSPLVMVTMGADKKSALCLVTFQGRDGLNVPLYGINWS